MSRVGVLSRLHNAVGNLATYIWLRQSFVAISFERCRYFLAHVACRNLPWQGLTIGQFSNMAAFSCVVSREKLWFILLVIKAKQDPSYCYLTSIY